MLYFVSGLPPQHLAYYAPPDSHQSHSPNLPKYHENGQDNFSDFVSLVCQDGSGGIPPGPSRSPKVSSSYYSPTMYPPPPPPPGMSRPVPLVRSTGELGSSATSSPPVSTSPGDQHAMPGYDLMPPILSNADPSDGKTFL